MSRWIDSNLADRLYMVQKRINFPVPMIHRICHYTQKLLNIGRSSIMLEVLTIHLTCQI